MLSKYISLPVFLVSFAIGLFCVYAVGPEFKTVYLYPNPDNYEKYLFKDNSGQCFQIKPVETQCGLLTKSYPVQN
jgi:hypothetical protein